jgi:hypothetical protein
LYAVHKGESGTAKYEIQVFEVMMATAPQGGRYLCYGTGSVSDAVGKLRDRGYDCMGYDPYVPGKINQLDSRKKLEKLRFSGIFSNNVIEHFQDPVEEFVFMKGLLEPDGVMSHATGCYAYRYEYSSVHLFFLEGLSLQVLCNRTGTRIIGTKDILPDHRVVSFMKD